MLSRKPGALRNGRPFVSWQLPKYLQIIWNHLIKEKGGDRQIVNILSEIKEYGMDIVEHACQEAVENNIFSDTIIINLIRRSKEHSKTSSIEPPQNLQIKNPPVVDLKQYDILVGNQRNEK